MNKNNKILICIISALTLICLVFLTSLNYLMADTINEQIQYMPNYNFQQLNP